MQSISKNPVKTFWLLSMPLFLISCALGIASDKEASKNDWIPLFDGQTLDGWEQKGGKGKYSVVDGTIVGETNDKHANTFLCTKKTYSDFILEYEFKVGKMNSGVQIRSNTKKNDRVFGYQVEIDPSKRAWTAGIYDESRRGWLDPKKVHKKNNDTEEGKALLERSKSFTEQGQRIFKTDDWNKVKVHAEGGRIRTWLNGEPRADLKDSMTATGFIGLQVHAHKQQGHQVSWKNIRIKVLNADKNEAVSNKGSTP